LSEIINGFLPKGDVFACHSIGLSNPIFVIGKVIFYALNILNMGLLLFVFRQHDHPKSMRMLRKIRIIGSILFDFF
jgi:hypothetical protein